MINDLRLAKTQAKSLDQWVEDTISQVNEIVYLVIREINLVMSEVKNYVR